MNKYYTRSSTGVTTMPQLPKDLTPNSYRFFCRVIRTNIFDQTVVLDVEGQEVTLKESQVKVGLVDGNLCADIKEHAVKQWGLA
jgi:hypothetical protein